MHPWRTRPTFHHGRHGTRHADSCHVCAFIRHPISGEPRQSITEPSHDTPLHSHLLCPRRATTNASRYSTSGVPMSRLIRQAYRKLIPRPTQRVCANPWDRGCQPTTLACTERKQLRHTKDHEHRNRGYRVRKLAPTQGSSRSNQQITPVFPQPAARAGPRPDGQFCLPVA